MQKQNKTWGVAFTISGALTLLIAMIAISKPQTVQAQQGDLNSAAAKYPNIVGSGLQSCNLCHTASIPDLNPYGADYLNNGRNTAAFGLIENLDSDGDGATNLQEFNALTFPGNPASFPPVATPINTTVPPTFTSIPPTFTPAPATATNTSVPPTFTSVPATTTSTSVLPTFTSVPATATNTSVPPIGTSTFTSVPPTATNTSLPPTATPISTVGTPAPSGLDLDIRNFKVTSEIELKDKEKTKPIKIRLDVKNSGSVNGQGVATVIGIQNGIEIYNMSMVVSDPTGGGYSRFSFPSYTPTVGGKIVWTVTLVDDNPDNDVRVKTTKVKDERDDDDDDDNDDDDHHNKGKHRSGPVIAS